MQYRVGMSILSDICTLVTRLLSHIFNHSIYNKIGLRDFQYSNVACDNNNVFANTFFKARHNCQILYIGPE